MKKIILTLMLLISTLLFANDKAPNFDLVTITGEKVSLSGYVQTKKPTLIYFSASWCPVCAKNWPSINKVYKKYNDRVNFLSISIDPTDTNIVLEKLAKKHNLIYPMVAGNPKLMIDFGVKSQATTVLLNSKGEITDMYSGHITLQRYQELLDKLLEDE